ncbi:Stk1 family PASTA domain-containing Ser/Thr kinase [Cryptosporangium arvum]|uniref:Stk1 family PASTA domain-containing Ser/Thr kinase n=1 Tax=Cryptosporangium arvum TaxID=80871 RepID=UPI0005688BFA|nr:Stk1 family PASTA domain-containing Ser/Thr kinase [Cryptosporangium arvum]
MDRTLADPMVGSVLEGRYRIRGRIARGGMATVYDAVDERLERTVAVKVMHPGYASDPAFVHRFIQEARSAAALSHPHVVAVYDQGVHEGLAFLVMEQVQGRTLRDVLTARGRLPASDALAILDPVLDALAAAHRAGMVHRDVKPENVLIGSDGRAVKVADFGLARAVASVGPTSTRGVVMGTVAYVSPEQITYGQASTRSDVYSAGIMLFEMLTGSVPYGGDSSVNIAFQHVHADVPPPSSRAPLVPPAIDELAMRATRRDPNARPDDAGAFLDELRVVRDELEGRSTRSVSGTGILQGLNQPSGPPTITASAAVPVPQSPGQHTQVVPRGHEARGTAMMPNVAPLGGGHRANGPSLPGPLGRLSPQHRRLALIAAIVVVALIAASTGWYLGVGRYTSTPSFDGLNREDAINRAKTQGLRIEVLEKNDDKALNGRVFDQSPDADGRIRKGGTVTVTISKGPNVVTIPATLAKKSKGEARTTLEKAGFKVAEDYDFSDDVESNKLISTTPLLGTKAKYGSTVLMLISRGKGVELPDLEGRSREEAEQRLQELNLQFTIEIVESDNPDQAGKVIEQTPDKGQVSGDTTIKLEVAQGQAQVEVPDVVGKRFNEARDILEEAGLRADRQGGGRGDDEARVFFQVPSAGDSVAGNSRVRLFVG